jgi:hypothetical protein
MSIKMNQVPILIGIVGNIGVGKSLVADYLVKNGFNEYAFAKPVKDIALNMGFSHQQIYGTQSQKLKINKYWGISAREFLQKLGTDIGRNILPTAIPNMDMGTSGSPWVRLFEIHWEKMLDANNHPVLVVSDCRFPDEVASIKARGGYIIKITRPCEKKDGYEYNHESETGIDKLQYDMLIVNNGTKENLFSHVDMGILYAKGISLN